MSISTPWTDDQKKDIKNYSSKSLYSFGDGEKIQATRGASIPAVIGNTKVQINTDVICKDLPLLLSKSFMKRANMVLDFENDTALALGENVHLATTSSGHYFIPLTKPKQLISSFDKNNDNVKIVLVSKESKTDNQIALKLHRQFAHPLFKSIIVSNQ